MDWGEKNLRSGSEDDEEIVKSLDVDTHLGENLTGDNGVFNSLERVNVEAADKSLNSFECKFGGDRETIESENSGDIGGNHSVEDVIVENGMEMPNSVNAKSGCIDSIMYDNGDRGRTVELFMETGENVFAFSEIKVGDNGQCIDEIGDSGGRKSEDNKNLSSVNGEQLGNERTMGVQAMGTAEAGAIDEGNGHSRSMVGGGKGETLGKVVPLNETKDENLESNGPSVNEFGDFSNSEFVRNEKLEKEKSQELGTGKAVEMPSKTAGFPSGATGGALPVKGYGLKKWRRIRRDATDSVGSGADPSRILKRGPSNAADFSKHRDLSGENKQKSEGSSASVTSVMTNFDFSSMPLGLSDSEPRFMLYNVPVMEDPENSGDWSSKSSTAASTMKAKQEMPVTIGHGKDKNKGKNQSGRIGANSLHRGQSAKGKVESSKKLRGEKIKNEENSYSSVESDERSFGSVFPPMGSFDGVSSGREMEKILSLDGENSDGEQACEPQSSEEVRTDYYKDNREGVEEVSREDSAATVSRENGNHNKSSWPKTDTDRLVESVFMLQAAHDALEKEIQNIRKIGTTPPSFQMHFEEMEASSYPPIENRLIELTQRVNLLQSSLEGARKTLKAKESRILELESILSGIQFPIEAENNLPSVQEMYKVKEIELEDLIMKKMEAEIEYLAIIQATQNLKVVVDNRIALFEEQKLQAREQMVLKLRDSAYMETMLNQAEKLEASSRELERTGEALKAQNKMCKLALFCFIQFVLLCLFLRWFMLQLPDSDGVVPT